MYDSSYALITALSVPKTDTNAYTALASVPWSHNQTALSVAGWVNPGAANDNAEGLFGNWNAINTGHILFRYGNTSGTVAAFLRTTVAQYGPATGPSNTALDTWTHVAMTMDSSNFRVYVNGSAGSDVALTGSLAATSQTVPRFGYISTSQYGFIGWQRDWAFWDGVTLTGAAVQSLANGANPLTLAPSNYWPLGNTLRDWCGKNHLTAGSSSGFQNTFTGTYHWLPHPAANDFQMEAAAAVAGGRRHANPFAGPFAGPFARGVA